MGHIPAKGEHEQKVVRVFYVAATRAKQRLVIGAGATNSTAPIFEKLFSRKTVSFT